MRISIYVFWKDKNHSHMSNISAIDKNVKWLSDRDVSIYFYLQLYADILMLILIFSRVQPKDDGFVASCVKLHFKLLGQIKYSYILL